MDDFEAKLRRLALRAPSERLDARVLAEASAPRRATGPRRQVPAWLAAAAALLMGVVGFAGGQAWRGDEARIAPVARTARPAPITVQVIYNAPASPHPFDFTRASDIFPAGRMEATIQQRKGDST